MNSVKDSPTMGCEVSFRLASPFCKSTRPVASASPNSVSLPSPHSPRLWKALLVLYFRNFLGWDDDLSTAIYHTFVALCYLTPILGALIADSWLGKFK